MSSFVSGGNVFGHNPFLKRQLRNQAIRRLIGFLALTLIFPTIVALRALAATHITSTADTYMSTSANVIYNPLNLVLLILMLPFAMLTARQMYELEHTDEYPAPVSIAAMGLSISLLLAICTSIPMLYVTVGQNKFDAWLAARGFDTAKFEVPDKPGTFTAVNTRGEKVTLSYNEGIKDGFRITILPGVK